MEEIKPFSLHCYLLCLMLGLEWNKYVINVCGMKKTYISVLSQTGRGGIQEREYSASGVCNPGPPTWSVETGGDLKGEQALT